MKIFEIELFINHLYTLDDEPVYYCDGNCFNLTLTKIVEGSLREDDFMFIKAAVKKLTLKKFPKDKEIKLLAIEPCRIGPRSGYYVTEIIKESSCENT